ncbi:hypothetical protein SAMN04487972_14514 [Paracoccus halophilus]|uniref:CoA-binding domain-containing protein n=1 Tax=Paracoccus halophilus TaxID=376733 RepID=A0A1I0UDQ4_9RHOB|nr:CoA-binding protein [Paracoccus halophilus]SFA62192.1 hypothetical protein SAMN04487972_14514 [Paracoccus halophilus]
MNLAVLRDTGSSPVDMDVSRVIRTTRCIAIVGLSPNESRPSWGVARYLKSQGYRIIPVNPVYAGRRILDERIYSDLHSIPREAGVDMVDIFRQSQAVPGIVEEAMACLPGLQTIWMQLGISHAAAANRARAQGLTVIEDRCAKIEFSRLH